MAKKDLLDKIAKETIDAQAYNPLMAGLRESDKRNLFNSNAMSFFHKTGFPMFDYYFGSVVNIHNEVGEIIRQDPRVGQAAGTFNMVVGNTGTGKALPDDTRVPTPTGMRLIGQLKIGDFVFGPDGKPTVVVGAYPQGSKNIWRVNCSNGKSARCSPDHLWSYQYRLHGKIVKIVDTTEAMYKLRRGSDCKIPWLPRARAVQFNEQPVSVHPYLLGLCVINGKFSQNCLAILADDGNPLAAVPKNCQINPQLKAMLAEVINTFSDDSIDKKSWCRDTICHLIESIHFTDFGSLIPGNYIYNSEEIRWQLLRGLIDGGGKIGFVDRRDHRKITVTVDHHDRALLLSMVDIIRSLGLDAVLTDKVSVKPGTKGKYRLKIVSEIGDEFINCIDISSDLTRVIESVAVDNGFRTSSYNNLNDKTTQVFVEEVVPSDDYGDMTCIKVARNDGLFITEDYLVTHNTTLTVQIASNIIRPYENGSILHYDFEQRFDISRGENISRLPIRDFAEGGRYVLQQGMLSLEDIQEALVKVYADKMKNRDSLLISTGQMDEFGKEIRIFPPTVAILDSVANIIPDTFSVENAKDLASAQQLRGNMAGARDAKTVRGFLRDISPLLKQANIIVYAINHINASVQISMFSGPTKQMNFLKPDESIPGGKALFYNSYNLPKLVSKPSDDFTESTDGFNGHLVMIEPIKSSSNQSGNNSKGIAFDMVFSYKQGFDSLRSLILYGKERGIIDGTKLRMKFVEDNSFTFAWKNLDVEKNEKPIWESIKKFIIPELETHLSFVEPTVFDERSMDY